ncbi:hypothetical protein M011DRAFT_476375 [Sporormia fimetaria CBS 119925]|uniref:DUF6594 domain-containing protein n=1 Tax=Sporormia fimetaria CBS 119925 TaxID=1340428 RepID=A0A6A6VCP8_9PLEO|nr:hypothetical protein M011DRAFT_476375 [Sporormia fimetaria CBS 119925]
MVAVLIPILAMVTLIHVNTWAERFGAIAGFNILFALSMMYLTQAKRGHVFAAVALFTTP